MYIISIILFEIFIILLLFQLRRIVVFQNDETRDVVKIRAIFRTSLILSLKNFLFDSIKSMISNF